MSSKRKFEHQFPIISSVFFKKNLTNFYKESCLDIIIRLLEYFSEQLFWETSKRTVELFSEIFLNSLEKSEKNKRKI